MMGLAGLVGVGPVRGVVREGVACAAPHSEMILALSYLIAETMDKVCVCVCVCVCVIVRE